MWLYSHLVIASKTAPYLPIDDLDAYYLGAAVPDIRHWVEVRRAQTHVPPDEIAVCRSRYPALQSFALGYLVHLVSEDCTAQLGLDQAIVGRFPFSLIRRRIPGRFTTVLLEWHYLAVTTQRYQLPVRGNEILRDLGIDDDQVAAFAQDVNAFLSEPSPKAMLAMLEEALAQHPRYRDYVRIPQLLERRALLRQVVFAMSAKALSTFDDHVGPYVASLPPIAAWQASREPGPETPRER